MKTELKVKVPVTAAMARNIIEHLQKALDDHEPSGKREERGREAPMKAKILKVLDGGLHTPIETIAQMVAGEVNKVTLHTVGQTLSQMTKKGLIRRSAKGVYQLLHRPDSE